MLGCALVAGAGSSSPPSAEVRAEAHSLHHFSPRGMALRPPLHRAVSDEGRELFMAALSPAEAPHTVAQTKEKQQKKGYKKKMMMKNAFKSDLRPDTLDLLAAGLGDPQALARERTERRRREKAERASKHELEMNATRGASPSRKTVHHVGRWLCRFSDTSEIFEIAEPAAGGAMTVTVDDVPAQVTRVPNAASVVLAFQVPTDGGGFTDYSMQFEVEEAKLAYQGTEWSAQELRGMAFAGSSLSGGVHCTISDVTEDGSVNNVFTGEAVPLLHDDRRGALLEKSEDSAKGAGKKR